MLLMFTNNSSSWMLPEVPSMLDCFFLLYSDDELSASTISADKLSFLIIAEEW